MSVRISTREEGTVRVLYVSPADRQFRADYSEVITHAIVDVQSWYRRQMGGLTFQLHDATPEWCQMSGDSEYYGHGEIWDKVIAGVQHCAPVVHPEKTRTSHGFCTWTQRKRAMTTARRWGRAGGASPARRHRPEPDGDGGGPWVYCDIGEYDRPFLAIWEAWRTNSRTPWGYPTRLDATKDFPPAMILRH